MNSGLRALASPVILSKSSLSPISFGGQTEMLLFFFLNQRVVYFSVKMGAETCLSFLLSTMHTIKVAFLFFPISPHSSHQHNHYINKAAEIVCGYVCTSENALSA